MQISSFRQASSTNISTFKINNFSEKEKSQKNNTKVAEELTPEIGKDKYSQKKHILSD